MPEPTHTLSITCRAKQAGHRSGAPVSLAVSWVEKVRAQNGVTDGRPMEDLMDIDSLQSFTFM